jgi:antitoxin component YwqK of YwqJK toxin-antitoxin module
MKFFFFVLLFAMSNTFGQSYLTKEVKITYSNGIDVINVCVTNPQIDFNETKNYFWYYNISGSSEIKNTEGGCGGNLLHGKERFFDKEGNLLSERNYHLGLLDGESKYWDSTGKLKEIYRHASGELKYKKIKVQGGWFEEIGGLHYFLEGYTQKNFDEIGNLISELVFKGDNYIRKDYYQYSNKIKLEYSTSYWCDTCKKGKYVSYYENGNKQVEGQFDDSLENIKVGIWKSYKETGEIKTQESYKSKLQRWPNGKWKVTGGYLFDVDSKK